MRLTRVALGTVALGFVITAVPSSMTYGADHTVAETVDSPNTPVVGQQPSGPVPIWEPDGAVLYNNGPLVTHPNGCQAGTTSASRLQENTLLLTLFGFGAQISAGNRMADNFTVPAGGGWNISELVLFSYQTGSTTTPTHNDVRVQIWNGPPNAGGVVVFGNTTTNRFASAAFSTFLRDQEAAPCATNRPIMAVRATINTTLPPGTYWVDYSLGGSAALSGPWVPPTTILGQTDGCAGAALCNALQFTTTSGAWGPALDGAIQQDVPFAVEGVALGSSVINAGNASVTEGNAGSTDLFLPVTLDVASPTQVTVAFATADNTATAGTDYTATSGTLTFAPGQTSKNVTVSVTGDVVDELDETFFVNLSSPSGATIGDGQGVGTIVDDDSPTVNIGDVSQAEGNTGASDFILPVTLSASSPGTVTVAFTSADGTANAPSDYTSTSGTLTFAPGVTSLGVTVSVNGDVIPEDDETFFVNLSAPSGATIGDGQGQGTIVNDDAGPDTTGELSHRFRIQGDLASALGTPDEDTYQISQKPYSSYEVVVDGASGDISPVALERVQGTTVLQTALPIGTGTGQSLRWTNDTASTVITETVRVASGGCSTDCGADDVYRLKSYETTYSIPRFNNFGSQVTVLLLQNPTNYQVTATVYFWDPNGTLLHAEPVTLAPKSLEVRVTSTIPAIATAAGSVTVTHDGRYGDLAGKTVALEPATGFSFDSPMIAR